MNIIDIAGGHGWSVGLSDSGDLVLEVDGEEGDCVHMFRPVTAGKIARSLLRGCRALEEVVKR